MKAEIEQRADIGQAGIISVNGHTFETIPAVNEQHAQDINLALDEIVFTTLPAPTEAAKPRCTVKGCNKPVESSGLCEEHLTEDINRHAKALGIDTAMHQFKVKGNRNV